MERKSRKLLSKGDDDGTPLDAVAVIVDDAAVS